MIILQATSKDKVVKCLEAAKPNLPAKPVKTKAARPATAPAAPASQPESDISPDEPSETESATSSAPSAGSSKPAAGKGKAKASAAKKVRNFMHPSGQYNIRYKDYPTFTLLSGQLFFEYSLLQRPEVRKVKKKTHLLL